MRKASNSTCRRTLRRTPGLSGRGMGTGRGGMPGPARQQWPTMRLRSLFTCQGFPYLPRGGMKMLDTVTPYLAALMKAKLNIDCALEWMHTDQLFTCKLQTNQGKFAKYLCTTLLDLPVTLADSVAHLHFKSGYHMLARQETQSYFPPAHDHRHCP